MGRVVLVRDGHGATSPGTLPRLSYQNLDAAVYYIKIQIQKTDRADASLNLNQSIKQVKKTLSRRVIRNSQLLVKGVGFYSLFKNTTSLKTKSGRERRRKNAER